MRTLSLISLVLSLVFGCLLLALVAEFFYLFWWKKRVVNHGGIENGYSNPTKFFFLALCWKNPSSLSSRRPLNLQEPQAQSDLDNHLWDNPFGDEDAIDAELMRLQQLAGPPRFLFTIKEETNEDLESENGKSRVEETPYSTPIASPSYFTPPFTPSTHSQNHQKFHSFFDLASDAEFNKIRSSPPPTFKFLRDAEEKLYRTKINEERDRCGFKNEAKVPSSSIHPRDEGNGSSVITIIVSKNREKENEAHQHVLHYPSSSSQVLPTNF